MIVIYDITLFPSVSFLGGVPSELLCQSSHLNRAQHHALWARSRPWTHSRTPAAPGIAPLSGPPPLVRSRVTLLERTVKVNSDRHRAKFRDDVDHPRITRSSPILSPTGPRPPDALPSSHLGGPLPAEMLHSGPVEPEPVKTGGGKVRCLMLLTPVRRHGSER